MPKILQQVMKYSFQIPIGGCLFYLFQESAITYLSPLGSDNLSIVVLGLSTVVLVLLAYLILFSVQYWQARKELLEYNPSHFEDLEFAKHFDEFASKPDPDSRT